jgi:opacity protein-like surface antigen
MRRSFIVVAACLFLLTGTSLAQMKFAVGPHVGVSFSSFPKPLNEVYGTGFNFGAQGEMELMKHIGIRLGLDYGMFSSDKSKFGYTDGNGQPIPSSNISGLNVGMFSITASGLGKLPLQGGVTPYGILGFGLHISSVSDLLVKVNGQDYTTIKAESTTKFGMHFGAGTEYKINKNIGIFGEFKFMLIFTEGSSTTVMPLMFGANFWL